MGPRVPPRQRKRHAHVDSHFLKLPAEIRNHIYELALVKDAPIDLFPEVPDLNKPVKSSSLMLNQHTKVVEEVSRNTRAQGDLEFVRKELAVGLLRTCRQIFLETVKIFYGDNTFYFTGGDSEHAWMMAYRFLLTIGPTYNGPGARQYVNRIGVHLPSEREPPLARNKLNLLSKNWPKMHMAKVTAAFYEGHMNPCISLLANDKTLKELHLVVPSGWTQGYHSFQDSLIEDYKEAFDLLLPFLSRTILRVQKDAFLDLVNPVEAVNKLGWELLLEEGSYARIPAKNSEGLVTCEKVCIDKHLEFTLPPDEYEYLDGVSDMFDNQSQLLRGWHNLPSWASRTQDAVDWLVDWP